MKVNHALLINATLEFRSISINTVSELFSKQKGENMSHSALCRKSQIGLALLLKMNSLG